MKKIFGLLVCFLLMAVSAGAETVPAALKQGIDLSYNAQFPAAQKTLNNYIAAHPQDPRGYIVRGLMYDWKQTVEGLRGQLNETALADYKQANQLAYQAWENDQNNLDKMSNLGNSHLFLAKKWIDMGKSARAGLVLKKAKTYMYEVMEKDPSRTEAYLAVGAFNFFAANVPSGFKFLASLLGITGDETKGLQQLTDAATKPNLFQSDALFMLTYAYGTTKKNYGSAVSYLKQLHQKYPNNPHFLLLMGDYAHHGKRYGEARQYLSELSLFCASQPCSKRILFLSDYFTAMGHYFEKNYSASQAYAEKAEKNDSGEFKDRSAFICLMKGEAYLAKGKKKQAKSELEKVLAHPGADRNAKLWAGEALKKL